MPPPPFSNCGDAYVGGAGDCWFTSGTGGTNSRRFESEEGGVYLLSSKVLK